MFHFKLRSVADITPWGQPPHLHNFGLTDGCFWINTGSEELFRYTPEVLACWRTEALEQGKTFDTFGEPNDAYQVIRLVEDLADVLPHAVETVPPEVAAHVDLVDEWRQQQNASPVPVDVLRAFAAEEGREFSDAEEMFYAATGWWGHRQLPVMHLRFNPMIHIWSRGDDIEIRWDNRGHRYNGIQVWTADFGMRKLPRSDFIQAVKDFHHRFLEQMNERVKDIERHWSRTEVAIDLALLRQEQRQRELSLGGGFRSAALQTDWQNVRQTLERIIG